MDNIKPTSVRLDPEVNRELEALSVYTHRSKSYLIKEAVSFYLSERADLEIALEKYRDPATEYVDWKDVKNEIRDSD